MSERVGSYLEMSRMVERTFAVILLVLSLQLKKRKKTAWEMTMIVLSLSFLRGAGELIHTGMGNRAVILIAEGILLCLFMWYRKDFCCPVSKKIHTGSSGILLFHWLGVAVNVALTYHYMNLDPGREAHFPLESLMFCSVVDVFWRLRFMYFVPGWKILKKQLRICSMPERY